MHRARGIVPRQAVVAEAPKLSERQQAQKRYAEREAERMVAAQWSQAGMPKAKMPLDDKCRKRNRAKTAVREVVQEELSALRNFSRAWKSSAATARDIWDSPPACKLM